MRFIQCLVLVTISLGPLLSFAANSRSGMFLFAQNSESMESDPRRLIERSRMIPILREQPRYQPAMELFSEKEAADQALSPRSLEQLDQMALKLLKAYPTEDHVFVSLGTSPALLSEVLYRRASTLDQHADIRTLPLSISTSLDVRPQMDLIAQHFETILTPEILNGKKRIVFLDFVSTGKTLKGMGLIFRELHSRGVMTAPVKFAGISANLPILNREEMNDLATKDAGGVLKKDDIQYLPVSRYLYTLFQLRSFKQFAKYESWTPAGPTYVRPVGISDDKNSSRERSELLSYTRADMKVALDEYFAAEPLVDGMMGPPVRSKCEEILTTPGR